MTYGPVRSANAELHEGMTDGKYKKVVTDRGGFPEGTTYAERSELHDQWYGIHEIPVKHSPDGLPLVTPNYRPTAPVRIP